MMNKQITRYIIRGFLCIVVLGLLYYPFYNGDSTTSIEVMDKTITKQMNQELVAKQDATGLKRYMEINVKDTDGFVYYTSKSMMDVDEVLIIRLKSGDDGEQLRKAVTKRVDTQLKNFNGYGTNQCDLLNHHILITKKGYLFYATSKQADTWVQSVLAEL